MKLDPVSPLPQRRDLQRQLLLAAREVVVDRSARRLGVLQDRGERRGVVTVLGQQLPQLGQGLGD